MSAYQAWQKKQHYKELKLVQSRRFFAPKPKKSWIFVARSYKQGGFFVVKKFCLMRLKIPLKKKTPQKFLPSARTVLCHKG